MTGDKYQLGYSEEWLRLMSERSVDYEGAHVARFMKPGYAVLDAGCGPGSLTVGFASIVEPGFVTGIDISEEQFTTAREFAAKQGVKNVRFEAGDVHHLAFGDHSFDIVNANALLMHLSDPEAA